MVTNSREQPFFRSSENKSRQPFERYIPERFRRFLEDEYYACIKMRADLESLAKDESFRTNPGKHMALYADHGIVHVRDVANKSVELIEAINGLLIPFRNARRLEFMKGYGVLLAYLHDIGMVDFTESGRRMHPEFAARAVFSPCFDPFVKLLWDENWGNMAWRLQNLSIKGHLTQNPAIALREMLAMSACHSKTRFPMEILNDPAKLKETMRQIVRPDYITENPGDFERMAYSWLDGTNSQTDELVLDTIDAIRVLRSADAMRQRGTTLKTSGGYEIFVDRTDANAIYALRKDNRLFLLTSDNPVSAGEANIAGSEITREGDMRVSFHRGAFLSRGAVDRAVRNAALLISDIREDIIDSFQRTGIFAKKESDTYKDYREIGIIVEGVDDNPEFAGRVCDELKRIDPAISNPVIPVPSLQHVDPGERDRYLCAEPLEWDDIRKKQVIEKIAESGHKTDNMNIHSAFEHVRLLHLKAGELLIEAETPSNFVFIPMGNGLKIIRTGGYPPAYANPWIPLGNTGVIRGSVRNASAIAEKDIQLLMVPGEIYLKHWHDTYSFEEYFDKAIRPT